MFTNQLLATLNFFPIVENKAYRSAQPTSQELKEIITRYNIKTVINLRGPHPERKWWNEEKKVCEKQGVSLVNIALSAHQLPSPEKLLHLYDTFLESAYPILIHCIGGSDRTGAASALWQMVCNGASREKALKELSFKYLHISYFAKEMGELVRMFEPSRDWIQHVYNPMKN